MCVAAPSNPGTDPLYKDPTAPPAYDEHDTTSQTAEQSTINTKDSKVQRLIQTLDLEYEIAADLLETEGTDIVVIADDSGSMQSTSHMPGRPEIRTRWHELQYTLRRLLEMLLTVDDRGGFELVFLNSNQGRPVSIRSAEDLEACWQFAKPGGATPLLTRLRENLGHGTGNERYLMVMTDGCPSDGSFDGLRKLVASKKPGTYANFLMCTDDEGVVERYEDSIDAVPFVDVHDDYVSEKAQVERCGRRLGYNQYLAKCVLGAKFPKYDSLDDAYRPGDPAACTCSIM